MTIPEPERIVSVPPTILGTGSICVSWLVSCNRPCQSFREGRRT